MLTRELFETAGGFDEALPACEDTASAFGCAYVLEGATLGGRTLLPLVEARLGLTAASGAEVLVFESPAGALRGKPGDAALTVEIELLDDAGAQVGKVAGLRLSRMGARRQKSLADGLLEVRWEPRPLNGGSAQRAAGRWLILGGKSGLADELAAQLAERGHEAVVARAGEAFECVGPASYTLRPEDPEDMRRLAASAGALAGAVHLWSLDARPAGAGGALEEAMVLGCGSALHLAQAMLDTSPEAGLWLVTRGAQAVGREPLAVEQSTLWGLGLVMGQEHPDLRGACVDLDPAHPNDAAATLRDEILRRGGEDRIAWRDGVRYAARLALDDGRAAFLHCRQIQAQVAGVDAMYGKFMLRPVPEL